ncbi:protein kinase domain-containing protein [Tuwongella immobilis]|uniref:Protein kinase domain-containing protein n=1 Tax=Tuwongella immobilis TaxID=692036 RepID=A0A6C2YQU7_9BACT|nr:protein kinase [Tuwongella immobilis]VIP04020.1 serine threonine protein kinase : WD40 repeat-containing protein OS=Singulisphaera acidiphila (strain ATCC BAA-1392 / DSM 18658 / VKM B-2454 / MOB10) GN=Sinac_7396 PE=3 SV=1: Pkinase [Tuwongella immobilis]VTS05407.1 serine threonine protein kinase : WD40 repeat-containing protein OS=Singulisphaera acidiphila (strain ATCC BAA-1392 / DSM 18658 / VKM B-2454 / MOB10) GN=Sinac_7396 PE=3 SV=1: Pkinase [Tuwongella immobilis]
MHATRATRATRAMGGAKMGEARDHGDATTEFRGSADRIDSLLSEYERRCDAGESVSAADLCADAPDLLPDVLKKIAALDAGRRMIRADSTPADATHHSAMPSAIEVPGYEIIRKLGEGGMGVVYLARQQSLNRLVALKMLAGIVSPNASAKMRQEASVLAQFSHPNVVQVYDVGEVGGLTYFALELMPGGSLSDRLDDGPIAPREAVEWLLPLTAGLQAMHQVGVIHCDLKPANVLLDARGIPKLADFGLARQFDTDSQQTRTGTVRGTPSYMAPEQARGMIREFGPTVDVYALGGILYELLTGRPPFLSASVLETLRQVQIDEPVPPRRLNPDVPLDLETICLKCLEKSPAKRYPNAMELADDLRRFLDGRPVLARRLGPMARIWRWSRRHPSRAALIAVCLLTGMSAVIAGFWVNRRLGAELQRTRIAQELTQESLVQQAADRLDAELRELAAVPQLLASMIEAGASISPELLVRSVENDPRVFGLCIALPPESGRGMAMFAHQEADRVRLRRLDQEPGVPYTERDWYRFGQEQGRGWTEPYAGTDVAKTLLVSRVVPIRKHGQFAGVVVLDLAVTSLRSAQMIVRDLIPGVDDTCQIRTASGTPIYQSPGFEPVAGRVLRRAVVASTGWELRLDTLPISEN